MSSSAVTMKAVPFSMEVNARLSGSIELASRSGVDFPLMLWQWASGAPVQESLGYRTGVRLRWLTGDGRWLLETLRGPGRPDSVPAGRAVATFAADFARRSAYDFFDLRDPYPSRPSWAGFSRKPVQLWSSARDRTSAA